MLKGGAGHADIGYGRASFEQERNSGVTTSQEAPSPNPRHASLVQREQSPWRVRSPRATEVRQAALADLSQAGGGSPVKLKAQPYSSSGSTSARSCGSPARWRQAPARALSPIPILHGSNSAASSPTPPSRLLNSRDGASFNGNSRLAGDDADVLQVHPATLHHHPSSQQHANGAAVSVLGQQLNAHRASSASGNNGGPGGLAMQLQLGVRDAAAVESPGRPRRTTSAPGSQLHTYAVHHATLQQPTGVGDNSPRPHYYSSIAARVANHPSYQNLPLDVASLDGHTQSCDTPDSNWSVQSTSSAIVESPHQPATTRFKPRPPGGSNSNSASSTPHSSTPGVPAGSAGSCSSLASASSGGAGSAGGAASSLQPHPPQSVRKASKPMQVGVMASLPETGSPHVQGPLHSMGSFSERCSNSPIPSMRGDSFSDQGGGSSGSGSIRRRNYREAPVAADVPGVSKPGPAFMRPQQASLMGLNSAGTEGGSNPDSPVGVARTPSSSSGGCFHGSMSRQDSGVLTGELLGSGTGYALGGASPYGSTGGGSSSAVGAAAIMSGAFSSGAASNGVAQVMFGGSVNGLAGLGVHSRSSSGMLTAASPLGNSSSAGINNSGGSVGVGSMTSGSLMATAGSASSVGSYSMGPPPPQLPQQQQPSSSGLQTTGSAGSGAYSRPSSGSKGCKTVCLLVDAVRSKDASQLQENLRFCTGGLHGLNDLHPTIDKTPLHEAVSLGYVSMVRMLLDAGSNPNLGPEKQGGPLLQAAGMGSCEIVQQLLSAGARVDATDAQGRTALHHACGGGHVEVARLLISWGAALTLRTVYGEAPMDLARPEVQRALCCGPDERSPTAAQAEAARSAAAAIQQQAQGGAAQAAAAAAGASSTAVTPDGGSAAATPAAPGSAGAAQGLSRSSSSGNCPLITPAVTPGSSGSVLQGGMFMPRRPSSSGGGHSSSGGSSSNGGGVLSLLGNAAAVAGGSAAATGPNTAVSSPSGVLAGGSGVLPAPPLASTSSGGHGTPPTSPSSFADAVGTGGLRRPSPPVSACGPGSAMSGGGSSAGSRWGSRVVSALSSAETGEHSSSAPLEQLPEECAPTPPALHLPIGRFNRDLTANPPNRKQRTVRERGTAAAAVAALAAAAASSSAGAGHASSKEHVIAEDTQRSPAEDDQAVTPAGSQTAADEAVWQAAGRLPASPSQEQIHSMQNLALRDAAMHERSTAAGDSASGSAAGTPSAVSALMYADGSSGFGSFVTGSSNAANHAVGGGNGELSRLSAPAALPSSTSSSKVGFDTASPRAALFRASMGSMNGSRSGAAPQIPQQKQQNWLAAALQGAAQQQPSPYLAQQQANTPTQQQKQQPQVAFKFGVDSPADARQAAKAAAATAAAAVAARHQHMSSEGDGSSSSSAFDQSVRFRLADSIPRQLPSAMQQHQQGAQLVTAENASLQPREPNETRVAPLLQGQSPPPTPEGAGVTPARLFESQQQTQQQQQQGRGGSSSLSGSIPQLVPSAQPEIRTSSEGLGPLAARMFGQSVDLQMGDMEWTCGRLLGEGAYGKVFEGLNKHTGELMAVKALQLLGRPDSEAVQTQLQELTQELHMYKQLKHPHIVGYIDARFDMATNTLYIFLENVPGGSIASMLQRFGGPFPENVARNYTRQLLLGLEYLHSQLIVHRDVKGGNALLTTSGIVKLADFGASKIHKAGEGKPGSSGEDGGDANRSVLAQSLRGSACWMAPEVVRGQGYGRKADIWSLGCTVLEMLSGKHPWPDIDNQFAVMLAIHNATAGPPRPAGLSPLANDFLDHCFRMDPNDRSSAEQLLTHAWVAGQGSNPTRTRASLSVEV